PDIFERFQSNAPGVKLELFPNNSPIQIADIASGALDGGFVYLFEALPETVRVLPVAAHRVVLAVPRKWDLPAHATLTAASLSGRPFVTFPRATYPGYHDQLMGACAGAGLTLNVVQEVSTEAAILSLVSAGVGAALVNSANLSRPPAQVRFLELEDILLTLPLAFAYSDANRNAALNRFLGCLAEVAGAA
ncbi:MAG TPA: LysR family transcriptional regulator, partial [Janthinobacterium sp.]|nr:LysR family transcriptional regulator [Janthinobacterium sp.]